MWAASLSVCAAGWLIAHSLAYRLVVSGDAGSGAVVEQTGHGELAFSPYLMAVSATVLLLALGGAVVAGATRQTRPALPATPFVLLPLFDFAAHPALESLQHGGELSAGTALEPIFLAALAVQLPLALGALVFALVALAWLEGVGRDLTPRWCPRPLALASPAPLRLLIGAEHRPIIPALSSGCAERAPPRLALVR